MSISSAHSLGLRHQSVLATTAAVLVATVPTGKIYSAIKLTFSNNSSSAGCLASVYLVPPGQTIGNAYRVLPPTLVPSTAMMEFSCLHELTAGYTVQVVASVANLLTCMCSARELS